METGIQSVGGRRYRVENDHYRFDPLYDTEQVGDILVTSNHFGAHGGPHAFELKNFKGVHLEDIKLFAAPSPAFGLLQVGDMILGIGGKLFSYDPRTEFGKALTAGCLDRGRGQSCVR